MARSWGHALRPLTDEERSVFLADCVERPGWFRGTDAEWAEGPEPEILAARRRCSVPRCEGEIAYVSRYHYVTGRGGRVSWQERRLCPKHAERFATKNDLPMPEINVA